MLSLKEQDTIIFAYEVMHAAYREEQRRTKHQSLMRLEYLEQHLIRLQKIMKKLSPNDAGLIFSKL